jgi:hypothetical protein
VFNEIGLYAAITRPLIVYVVKCNGQAQLHERERYRGYQTLAYLIGFFLTPFSFSNSLMRLPHLKMRENKSQLI